MNTNNYVFCVQDNEHKEEFKLDEEEELVNEERINQMDIDEIARIQEEIFTAQSLERVGLDAKEPIYLNLNCSTNIRREKEIRTNYGKIKGMFDSGASINCINREYAYKYYRKYIKPMRGFYVRTANGQITISQYIQLKVRTKIKNKKNNKHRIKEFITKWYLLPKSPHKWIISRALFTKLGYQIVDPDGNIFVNKSREEEIGEDLIEDFYKHMEYPLNTNQTEKQETIHFIGNSIIKNQEKLHRYNNLKRIDEIVVTEKDTEIYKKDVHIGKIENTDIDAEFRDTLKLHKARYAKHAGDMGTIPNIEFEINLKPNTQPISKQPYPQSFKHTDEINKQCAELLKHNIITEAKSEWAAPVVLVRKPTRKGKEEWRMCVDYRGLNISTIKDKYKVPSIRDLYRKISGNTIFSSIDLRSGYYHIKIAEKDRYKTAFITDEGRTYQWNRMCFGFTNAPATFQRAMDKIFKGLPFVIVYIDDIIICSKNEKEHNEHLKIIF